MEQSVTCPGVRSAIIEESSTFNVTIPEGYSLSVFAIGGGGGGRGSDTGGSRGGFKHVLVDNHSNQSSLELTITIGEGGQGGARGGSTTIRGLPDYFSASGGLSGRYHGSTEPPPDLCGISITWGADGRLDSGSHYYDRPGQGGVIVDGRKPRRRQGKNDGEGFGAGGGYDGSYGYTSGRRAGFKGVVVLSLCKSV